MTQQQSSPSIPAPQPQPESDFYWEKCKAEELWLRHCKSCDSSYFYPRDICPECFSRDTDWIQSSGKGIIHTFSIVHRGPTPPFRDKAPYVPVIVELEEGPPPDSSPGPPLPPKFRPGPPFFQDRPRRPERSLTPHPTPVGWRPTRLATELHCRLPRIGPPAKRHPADRWCEKRGLFLGK